MKLTPALLAIFMIVAVSSGYAQLQYGVHAGIGLSNMTDPDLPTPDFPDNYHEAAPGFLAGTFGEYELSDRLGLYTEVNFERRGADYELGVDDFTIRFNYITVPVQVNYSFLDKFGIRLGPQINYALSKSSDEAADLFLDAYEDFDIGINLGASYNIFKQLALDLRYYHGLRNLNRFLFVDEEFNSSNEIEYAQNRNWGVGLRYYLN